MADSMVISNRELFNSWFVPWSWSIGDFSIHGLFHGHGQQGIFQFIVRSMVMVNRELFNSWLIPWSLSIGNISIHGWFYGHSQ